MLHAEARRNGTRKNIETNACNWTGDILAITIYMTEEVIAWEQAGYEFHLHREDMLDETDEASVQVYQLTNCRYAWNLCCESEGEPHATFFQEENENQTPEDMAAKAIRWIANRY